MALSVAVLIVAGFVAIQRRPVGTTASRASSGAPWVLVALAMLIYAQAPALGLLSDDFVLLAAVRDARLVPQSWLYVRPVPLAAWSVLQAMLPTAALPTALHVFNITLHGVNGVLMARLGRIVGASTTEATLAAALFVASPLAVEAVLWNAGVFDVLMTTAVLIAIQLCFDISSARLNVLAVSVMTAVAVLCKETAVATPLLIVCVMGLVWPDVSRSTKWGLGGAVLVATGAAVARFSSAADAGLFPGPSAFAAKELLVRPFAALALPLHYTLLQTLPAARVISAVLWPTGAVLATMSWLTGRDGARGALFAAAWVLASVAPLAAQFYVAPDLQNARYLYLAMVGWTIGLTLVVSSWCGRGAPGWVSKSMATAVLVVSIAATLVHQEAWKSAATMRETVLSRYTEATKVCAPREVTGLPDAIDGAYVFRNGFNDAVAGVDVAAGPPCALRWNGSSFEIGY